MPVRVVIARLAWFATAFVVLTAAHALAPGRALAVEVEEPLASVSLDDGECGEPVTVFCPSEPSPDDGLPPGLCTEDGSARVAPPPSLPVAPDKIEGAKRCPLEVVLRTARQPGSERDASAAFTGAEPAEPATMPVHLVAATIAGLEILDEIPYRMREAEGVASQLERPPTSPR